MRKMRTMLAVVLTLALAVGMFAWTGARRVQAADKLPKPEVKLVANKDRTAVCVIVSGTSDADGYVIYMKTKKSKVYKKIASVERAEWDWDSTTTTRNIGKGKVYFKVRTYKAISGKKIWSYYSKVKSITLKGNSLDRKGIAEKNTLKNGVTIVKTRISADGVFNSGGYGSIKYGGFEYADDIPFYPMAALIDSDGSFVRPYKETMYRYYCDDGMVSLVNPNGAYEEWYESSVEISSLDGKLILSDIDGATPMKDGYSFIINDKWENSERISISQIIDKKGRAVLDLKDSFTEICGMGGSPECGSSSRYSMVGGFGDGLFYCWTYPSEQDYCAGITSEFFYMDVKGKKVLSLPLDKYKYGGPFSEGLAYVMSAENGKIGFVNKKGKLVIPCKYDIGGSYLFCDGLAGVCVDGKCGYINTSGKVVIPLEYDEVYGASNGLAAVVKDGKCGLVDYKNNIVVPLEYDDISNFEGGVAYAVKDGYVYIISGYKAG